jgi:hypothetical protein
MAPRARKARPADLHDLATSLPQVEEAGSWGDRPAYTVGGKAFVVHRGPRKDAVDPETGELMDDVVMFRVPDDESKRALVESEGPWFTTPHFNGYRAVLLRLRDIGKVNRDELAEVVTDAWLAVAPQRLAKEFLAST